MDGRRRDLDAGRDARAAAARSMRGALRAPVARPAVAAELARSASSCRSSSARCSSATRRSWRLAADAAPLVDDRPKLMQQRGTRDERDALSGSGATRARRASASRAARLSRPVPGGARKQALAQFGSERLHRRSALPGSRPRCGQPRAAQVLHGTRAAAAGAAPARQHPDHQRALARLPAAQRERPSWVAPRVAGLLADCDFAGALALLDRSPRELEPLPQLRAYVQAALAHAPPVAQPRQ